MIWHFLWFFFVDTLGRKRSMILVNIPYFLGWFVLWHSSSVNEIILGFILLGLAVGLMEAAVVTYLGEIWYESIFNIYLFSFERVKMWNNIKLMDKLDINRLSSHAKRTTNSNDKQQIELNFRIKRKIPSNRLLFWSFRREFCPILWKFRIWTLICFADLIRPDKNIEIGRFFVDFLDIF